MNNVSEFPCNKLHTMYRHSSEDDLKEFKKGQPSHHINKKTDNIIRP